MLDLSSDHRRRYLHVRQSAERRARAGVADQEIPCRFGAVLERIAPARTAGVTWIGGGYRRNTRVQ